MIPFYGISNDPYQSLRLWKNQSLLKSPNNNSANGSLLVWGPVVWIPEIPLRIPIPFIFEESQESKPPGPQTNN